MKAREGERERERKNESEKATFETINNEVQSKHFFVVFFRLDRKNGVFKSEKILE